MNIKKLLKYTLIILIALLLITFSSSCKTSKGEPPTIKLVIYEGPEYITGYCVYRVEAIVTGYPAPEVIFSRNDGPLGGYKCQVNLENPQETYILKAIAKNSIGEATEQMVLEWNCTEETIKQDAEMKEETVIETTEEPKKFYKNIELYFEEKDNIFPSNWYRDPINIKTTPLSLSEYERTEQIALDFLTKYPDKVLENNLEKIFFFSGYEANGKAWRGGINSSKLKSIYIVNKGVENGSTDKGLEKLLHSEFSTILFKNYRSLFDENKWRQINPEGFSYVYEGNYNTPTYDDNYRSVQLTPSLYTEGFLFPYAQTEINEDLSSIAKNMMCDWDSFWEATRNNERLKQKLDLSRDFYLEINNDFESFLKSQYEKYNLVW